MLVKEPPEWWTPETRMRDLARAHDPVLTELVDHGFTLIRRFTSDEEMLGQWDFWEAVWMLNLQQAENSAASAWELAYTGYYVQAGALARLLTEYLAVVWYLPNHQEEADKWNDIAKRPPGAGGLLKKVFANDPEVDDAFGQLRKDVLHRFAHQDSWGLHMILGSAEEAGHLVVNARGMFDPEKFTDIARVVMPLHASVPLALNTWRGSRNPEWQRDAIAYRDNVAKWLDQYDTREANP